MLGQWCRCLESQAKTANTFNDSQQEDKKRTLGPLGGPIVLSSKFYQSYVENSFVCINLQHRRYCTECASYSDPNPACRSILTSEQIKHRMKSFFPAVLVNF